MPVGRSWIMPIVIAALAAVGVAVMGATITDLGPWYRSLLQPEWAPPDAAYGVAWTVIYAFTIVAAVTAWRAVPDDSAGQTLIVLFTLNGFLNIMWSLIFFRMRRPDWALIELIPFWLSIALLIVVVMRYSKAGALLLMPYLIWVAFAGYLNLAIVRLNAPF